MALAFLSLPPAAMGAVFIFLLEIQVEMSTRSTNRSFKKLMMVNKILPRDIYKSLCAQRVELVFTSHPTQVRLTYSASPTSASWQLVLRLSR